MSAPDPNEWNLTEAAVVEAAESLRPLVDMTPLLTARSRPGLFLKPENLQRTHSFKIRAAANALRLLPDEALERGVVTSSSGNFAQAVACAARHFGLDAVVVMMESANRVKVAATRSWGARVVFCEDRFEARQQLVDQLVEQEGRIAVHPFDHPDVVTGNATLGYEVGTQLPTLRNLAVPVSGGGLLAGAALGARLTASGIRVWGVQPEGSNAMALSFASGELESIERAVSIADGIAVTRPGRFTFPLVQRSVDGIITVSEDSIRAAVRYLALEEKLVVEPAGAVTVAAVLDGTIPADDTVCVLSGGNILPELLLEILG